MVINKDIVKLILSILAYVLKLISENIPKEQAFRAASRKFGVPESFVKKHMNKYF